MFKRILTGIDFSEASRAALFGSISLATKCLGKLEAVHVVHLLDQLYNPSHFLVPNSDWQEFLQGKLEEFFPKELYPNSSRTVVFGRSIPQEILKHAKEQNCDLIAVGTYGHSTLSNLLLGSVAQQLVRTSDLPVMIVRDLRSAENQYQGFSRILVPTDFSDTSQKALQFGVRLANFLKADLHLVHSIDLPAIEEMHRSYPFSKANLPDSCELNVDPVLQKTLENHSLIGKPVVATLVGDPASEILKYAESQHSDFVVMGTHGKKALERIFLGSVTSAVVSKSKIPVITLSPNL